MAKKADSYRRPDFNRAKFDREWNELLSKYQKQVDDAEIPNFFHKLPLNRYIIQEAESICRVYTTNKDQKFTFEFGLISCVTDLLQRKVDLSDPDMIRDFALFFIRTVEEYGVRYIDNDGDGKEYTNASLGDITKELYSGDHPLKLILFVTAFYTKACLTSESDPNNPINHIDDENDSIDWLIDKIIRNAVQCMNNMELTDDGFQEIRKTHIAIADVHIRGGTVGKGNTFAGFFDEVNKDPDLSEFCKLFEEELEFATTLKMGSKSISSCSPILIDMILGVCNIALYAAFVHAKGGKLRINLSTDRSRVILEPNNSDGTYTLGPRLQLASNIVIISQGMHPNAVKANLTNRGRCPRPLEHMRQLDAGITDVLEPLRGVNVTVSNGGRETVVPFHWRKSDFFQRLYKIRMSRNTSIVEDDQINYELLDKVLEEMEEAGEGLAMEEKKLNETTKKVNATRREIRKVERMIENEEAASNNDSHHQKKKKKKEEKAKKEEAEKKKEAEMDLDLYFGRGQI